MQFATIKGLRIEKYTLQSQNWRESAKTNKTLRLITARRNNTIYALSRQFWLCSVYFYVLDPFILKMQLHAKERSALSRQRGLGQWALVRSRLSNDVKRSEREADERMSTSAMDFFCHWRQWALVSF
jgi:hypothetical protein